MHEIIKDAVRDRFIKRAFITKGGEIEFQRFTFDTEPIRHVINLNFSEIRLAGHRAEGGKVGGFEMDPEFTTGWVRKNFKLRFRWRRPDSRVTMAEKGQSSGFTCAPPHENKLSRLYLDGEALVITSLNQFAHRK